MIVRYLLAIMRCGGEKILEQGMDVDCSCVREGGGTKRHKFRVRFQANQKSTGVLAGDHVIFQPLLRVPTLTVEHLYKFGQRSCLRSGFPISIDNPICSIICGILVHCSIDCRMKFT